MKVVKLNFCGGWAQLETNGEAAAQEEIDTAHKLAELEGWVGEKLAAPNPPPTAAPVTAPVPPESLDATMKDTTPPETIPPTGQRAPAGGASQAASAMSSQASAQGLGGLQGASHSRKSPRAQGPPGSLAFPYQHDAMSGATRLARQHGC